MAWRKRTAVAVPAWVEAFDDAPGWRETPDGWDPDDYRAECRWNDARLAWLRDHPAESREVAERLVEWLGTPVRADGLA